MNYKSITDKPNRINNLSKEDKILEIKQNLFKELANQSSHQIKYKGKNQNINYNKENINLIKQNNNEENNIKENDIYDQIYYQNNDNIINRNYNELSTNKNYYDSKFRNNRNATLTPIKSNTMNNNIYDEENDLMYIIAETDKKNNHKKHSINKINDNNIISCLALPFCHYHKFNIKLPKRYTCNFKNCSCCQLRERESRNILYENNENTKESSREYIYPSLENEESSNRRYSSVLEKFISKNKKKNREKEKEKEKKKKKKYIKKKLEDNFNIKTKQNNINKIDKVNNININLKNQRNIKRQNSSSYSKSKSKSKNVSLNSSQSGNMSNISLKFQKPEETNMKIPKKTYEDSDESLNKSLSEDFSLDFPDDININDDSDLNLYKRTVNKKNKESKIHFSVKYYQKLNKSFRIYCNEDNKKKASPFKSKSKEKKCEFLRYN